MKRAGLIAVLLFLGLIFFECNVDKAAEEATTKSQDFVLELDPMSVNSSGLICIPMPSLETFLNQFEEWDQIRDHVKEIKLKRLEYSVPANTTPVDGQITIYGGDDAGSVSLSDPWGQTDVIAANTTYMDYKQATLTSLGKDEFKRYLNERSLRIVVCGIFSPGIGTINLEIQLQLVIEITFTVL